MNSVHLVAFKGPKGRNKTAESRSPASNDYLAKTAAAVASMGSLAWRARPANPAYYHYDTQELGANEGAAWMQLAAILMSIK